MELSWKKSSRIIDETGNKHGRLFVVSRAKNYISKKGKTAARWNCLCECGTKTIVTSSNLRSKGTASCGCLQKENLKIASVTHGESVNGKSTSEHRAWKALNGRCYNKNSKKYQDYGGRGITVCNRWKGIDGFSNFLFDVGRRPTPLHSIDRKNNNGNYNPKNCKWSTKKEQGRNKRNNKILTFDGKSFCVSEWAEITGISSLVINLRLFRGWKVKRALTTPKRFKKSQKTKNY